MRGLLLYIYLRKRRKSYKITNLAHPIFLRRKSTDLATFEQIFVSKNYKIQMEYAPQIIVDLGANIGMTSIFFANQFPGAKIYAVEPEESNFEMLKKNTGQYSNIIAINKAIWIHDGTLVIEDTGKGEYAYQVRESKDTTQHQNVIGKIDCISMDSLLSTYSIRQIDVLKVDIEGAERVVFKDNYKSWLDVTNLIMIELHDWMERGASEVFIKAVSTQNGFSVGGLKEGLIFRRHNKTVH
jgi:FkbM family methyltransferase